MLDDYYLLGAAVPAVWIDRVGCAFIIRRRTNRIWSRLWGLAVAQARRPYCDRIGKRLFAMHKSRYP